MTAGPNHVNVVALETEGSIQDALSVIDKCGEYGRITIADGTSEDYSALIAYVKKAEAAEEPFHALVYGVPGADSMHVENLSAVHCAKVVWKDARGTVPGDAFLPRLAGALCACNAERSASMFEFDDLDDFQTADSAATTVEEEINAGSLVLINKHGTVYLGTGINTLQSVNETNATNDMRYIDHVETIDELRIRISSLFYGKYAGAKKNSASKQALFVSDILTILNDMSEQEILDPEFDNTAEINTDAMREYWSSMGVGTADLTDDEIKKKTIGRSVFVRLTIKVVGAMEACVVEGILNH